MFYSSFIVVQLTAINVYMQGKKIQGRHIQIVTIKKLINTSIKFACALKNSKYTEEISNINYYYIICKLSYVKSLDMAHVLAESLYILINISLFPLPSDNLKN